MSFGLLVRTAGQTNADLHKGFFVEWSFAVLLNSTPLTSVTCLTGPVNISEALYRAKVKDCLMIIQGLLLAACVAAIMLRKRKLVRTVRLPYFLYVALMI